MAKQKIHWFEFECPAYQGRDDSYTNAPGLITCKRCSKKLASRRTPRAVDVATGPENDDFCEHGVIRGECLICPPRY